MLYHCLRRRPNNKITLDRRVVFAGITTAILIVKPNTDHCKHSSLIQWRADVCKTGPTLKQHY